MTRIMRTQDAALSAARRYCAEHYPDAKLVLLCGSWARGTAHDDSDIDIVVLNPGMSELVFEGATFESWLVEVCALSPERVSDLFDAAKGNRSAPVPHQVLDGVLVLGDEITAKRIKDMALRVISDGPKPLSQEEQLELRWSLTTLLLDLQHAETAELPALAAQCYTDLAMAALDAAKAWRGERKTLRRALAQIYPEMAKRLDEGLRHACQGDPNPLVDVGRAVLKSLGGELRTYVERYQ